MRRAFTALLLLALAGAAAFALTRWPPVDAVETGRTPEYPDVQPRAYAQGEARVTDAARKALARLGRFEVVGSGSGPGGSEIQAIARTPVLKLKDEVTIRIRRQGGATRVTVRSRSRLGTVDFGQNARNIREFLAALDQELAPAR